MGKDNLSGAEGQIRKYIADEKMVFEDWYNAYYSTELFPGIPLAAMPNPKRIKQEFKKWFEQTHDQLYDTICIQWNYPAKRRQYLDQVELITKIADVLIASQLKIPSPLATATIIVRMGLDKLCKNCMNSEK